MTPQEQAELRLMHCAATRLRTRVLALVTAMVGGFTLFLATVWLLLRGSEGAGAKLGLLGDYFPGYAVSWSGAFIGLGYGLGTGALVGWVIARLYTRMAMLGDED